MHLVGNTECIAIQHHPRSLILAPTERAYATSYQSLKVTVVLPCTVSEITATYWLKIANFSYTTLI